MSLNVKMIRDSFEQAKPIGNKVVERFYENLFTDYPSAKPLFNVENMDLQKQSLLRSLVFIVDNLENPERLVPYLKSMGGRHINYGTEEKHYEWVGRTLLKTFGQFFGDAWTSDLQEQWALAFNTIANFMLEGAKETANETNGKVIPFPSANNVNNANNSNNTNNRLFELPIALKNQIKEEAKLAVRSAVDAEVKAAIEAEINNLGGMVSSYFKKSA